MLFQHLPTYIYCQIFTAHWAISNYVCSVLQNKNEWLKMLSVSASKPLFFTFCVTNIFHLIVFFCCFVFCFFFLQGSFAITLSLAWPKPRAEFWEKGEISFFLCHAPGQTLRYRQNMNFYCEAENRNSQNSRASYTAVLECKRKKTDTQ